MEKENLKLFLQKYVFNIWVIFFSIYYLVKLEGFKNKIITVI